MRGDGKVEGDIERGRRPRAAGVRLALAAVALNVLATPALAQSDDAAGTSDAPAAAIEAVEGAWRHGLTIGGGAPGYPEGFEHFGYVNPDAPKGGTVKLAWPRGFDSLNPYLPKGTPAPGTTTLLYSALMVPSVDEQDASAQYGQIAEAVKVADDFSAVTYRLNPDARWHDGEPIDAEDVVWSFETVTRLSPTFKFYFKDVSGAAQTAPGEVTFTFGETGNKELPYIMGQTPVLPKHWWSVERDGSMRIEQTRLDEMPLGSGPYRIASLVAGKTIAYERVPDFWGADHPTYRGLWNFGRIVYEVFEEPTVAVQGFKKNVFDWKDVNSAKEWATDYADFAPIEEGRVIQEEFPDTTSGRWQAFVLNLRRDKFQDPRVRRALNHAFDFETTKENRFYGQYERNDSYFDRTDLASSQDLPTGRELELLREVAGLHPDAVPETVFSRAYENPVGGNARALRSNLREADRLLREAGWEVVNGKRMKDGRTLTIEYVDSSPLFEPIVLPWFNNLQRLGIETEFRMLDASQEIERTRSRDFDVVSSTFLQSLSPGNEQREYWGSEAADEAGSRNIAGIKNPAVDWMIEKIVFAADREELESATRALDRLLLHNDYMIPQWVSLTDRTLRWDKFEHPEDLVERTRGFSNGWPGLWWHRDAEATQ